MALKQADRLESNNPQAYGVVRATEISGHKYVSNLDDLYSIPDCILSDSKINTDDDAIGQIWYVKNQNTNYRLVSWENRNQSSGWVEEKLASNISSQLTELEEDITTINGTGEGSITKAVSDLSNELKGNAEIYTNFGSVEEKIAEIKVNDISDGNGTVVTNDSGAVKINISIDEDTLSINESNEITIDVINSESINQLFQ